MTNAVEHLFMCLLFYMYFWLNVCSSFFSHFYWVGFFVFSMFIKIHCKNNYMKNIPMHFIKLLLKLYFLHSSNMMSCIRKIYLFHITSVSFFNMKWESYSHNIFSFALNRGISVLNLMLTCGYYIILGLWCMWSSDHMIYFSIKGLWFVLCIRFN